MNLRGYLWLVIFVDMHISLGRRVSKRSIVVKTKKKVGIGSDNQGKEFYMLVQ